MKHTGLVIGMALSMATSAMADDCKNKCEKHCKSQVVTNVVRCTLLEVADMDLQAGHTYRVMVNAGAGWRNWGPIIARSNVAARVWVPVASTRLAAWQVVDYTPGFAGQVVARKEPDCTVKPQWVVLQPGQVRPVL